MSPASRSALQLSLRGDREIVFTRDFNAPRELVFEAMTKPELVLRWLNGAACWTFETCEIDLRVGGSYRYVWASPEGQRMTLRGTYREVVPPERIVQTETFDDPWYPGEAIGTLVLTARDANTTSMHLTVEYASAEAREAVLKTPMDKGMELAYSTLDRLLPELLAR